MGAFALPLLKLAGDWADEKKIRTRQRQQQSFK